MCPSYFIVIEDNYNKTAYGYKLYKDNYYKCNFGIEKEEINQLAPYPKISIDSDEFKRITVGNNFIFAIKEDKEQLVI